MLMKKLIFILIVVASLIPPIVFAQGLPFGGLILTTGVPPNVTCTGDGPFMISPAAGPASTWNNGPGQVAFGQIVSGAWILGLYSGSTCLMEVPPPVFETTYPVFFTNFYGTSM